MKRRQLLLITPLLFGIAQNTLADPPKPKSVSSDREIPVIRLYAGPSSSSIRQNPPVLMALESYRMDLKTQSKDANPAETDLDAYLKWGARAQTLQDELKKKDEAVEKAYKDWRHMPPPTPGTPYRERLRLKAEAEKKYDRAKEEKKAVDQELKTARAKVEQLTARFTDGPGGDTAAASSEPQSPGGRSGPLYTKGKARKQAEFIGKTGRWESRGQSKGAVRVPSNSRDAKIVGILRELADLDTKLAENQREAAKHNADKNRTQEAADAGNTELRDLLNKIRAKKKELRDLMGR